MKSQIQIKYTFKHIKEMLVLIKKVNRENICRIIFLLRSKTQGIVGLVVTSGLPDMNAT